MKPYQFDPKEVIVAVDIGTTTIVAYLVELATGRVVGTGSGPNPQGSHGADVVSRVEFADTSEDALNTLHDEAVTVVNEAIAEACSEAGSVRCENIYEVIVVGRIAVTQKRPDCLRIRVTRIKCDVQVHAVFHQVGDGLDLGRNILSRVCLDVDLYLQRFEPSQIIQVAIDIHRTGYSR